MGTITPCTVSKPDGSTRTVRNLGWLLRNWRAARSVTVTEPPEGASLPGDDVILSVLMVDGSVYRTGFADRTILARFLDRPVLRGLPVNWIGREAACGPTLARLACPAGGAA